MVRVIITVLIDLVILDHIWLEHNVEEYLTLLFNVSLVDEVRVAIFTVVIIDLFLLFLRSLISTLLIGGEHIAALFILDLLEDFPHLLHTALPFILKASIIAIKDLLHLGVDILTGQIITA